MQILSSRQNQAVVYFTRRELIATINVLQIMLEPYNVCEFSPLVGSRPEEGAALLSGLQWLLARVESVRLRRPMHRSVLLELEPSPALQALEIQSSGVLLGLSPDQFNMIGQAVYTVTSFPKIKLTLESTRPAVRADIDALQHKLERQ